MQNIGRCLVVMSVALGACEPAAEPIGRTSGAIVNGSLETGWPGVGALTLTYPQTGYAGSFCTGALVAPQWVLTAAHCLPADDGDIIPANVHFFVGSDARTNGTGPTNGTLYPVDAFHIHPDFDPATLVADVALVHLATAVPNATVYPVNATFLDTIGQSAFYVGFGATEGINLTGAGLKRSTSLIMSWIYPAQFTADYVASNVCQGDSGGPSFLQIQGSWRIVGINSSVARCSPTTDPDCDPDPCKRTSVATRADAYATWIAETSNLPAPSCSANPAICACADACQGNVCDNARCRVADCETSYECLAACSDAFCQNGCYASATSAAVTQLEALFTCSEQSCGTLPLDEQSACVSSACGDEVRACFPVGTGPATCSEIYDCMVACGPTANACNNACFETGTASAQAELDAFSACLDEACGTLEGDAFQTCANAQCAPEIEACFPPRTGDASCEEIAACVDGCADGTCAFACFETGTAAAQAAFDDIANCADQACGALSGNAYGQCLLMNCASAYDACFPPANCAVTGGDCPSGEACFPTTTGATDCFASNGKVLGASCDIDTPELDCGDGALCVQTTTGICVAMCRTAIDCGPGRACVPLGPDLPDVGTCGCVDGDSDGACADVDCDDDAPAVKPGAVELCGDGIDNDCVGGDESCVGPADENPESSEVSDASDVSEVSDASDGSETTDGDVIPSDSEPSDSGPTDTADTNPIDTSDDTSPSDSLGDATDATDTTNATDTTDTTNTTDTNDDTGATDTVDGDALAPDTLVDSTTTDTTSSDTSAPDTTSNDTAVDTSPSDATSVPDAQVDATTADTNAPDNAAKAKSDGCAGAGSSLASLLLAALALVSRRRALAQRF